VKKQSIWESGNGTAGQRLLSFLALKKKRTIFLE
jgi:hypothetical protein